MKLISKNVLLSVTVLISKSAINLFYLKSKMALSVLNSSYSLQHYMSLREHFE